MLLLQEMLVCHPTSIARASAHTQLTNQRKRLHGERAWHGLHGCWVGPSQMVHQQHIPYVLGLSTIVWPTSQNAPMAPKPSFTACFWYTSTAWQPSIPPILSKQPAPNHKLVTAATCPLYQLVLHVHYRNYVETERMFTGSQAEFTYMQALFVQGRHTLQRTMPKASDI